jgi:hypothetical protein
MEIKNKIFLGGTCNDSSWRSELKYYLDDLGIDYFDPVGNITEDGDFIDEPYITLVRIIGNIIEGFFDETCLT